MSIPISLPPNFNDLLVRMIRGENLLTEPFGGVDGQAPPKPGKGSKVSPSVQMQVARVDAEMARLAQEVETLKKAKKQVGKANGLLAQETNHLLGAVFDTAFFKRFVHNEGDNIYETLRNLDEDLLHEHNVNAGIELS